MRHFELIRFANDQELADSVSRRWWSGLEARGGGRGNYTVALSGGRIAGRLFSTLAELARDKSEVLQAVHWFWGDERCVPPDDEQSNFRMARESLFVPGAVPEKSILRMRGEIQPQIAAQEYQDDLDLLATQRGEQIYRHDLILLGLGDDGHTASLFPETAALNEMTQRVVANFVPKFNSWRLTFTFPLINHARQVLFLVGGTKNSDLIQRVLKGDQRFPAARVNPSAGKLTWMIAE